MTKSTPVVTLALEEGVPISRCIHCGAEAWLIGENVDLATGIGSFYIQCSCGIGTKRCVGTVEDASLEVSTIWNHRPSKLPSISIEVEPTSSELCDHFTVLAHERTFEGEVKTFKCIGCGTIFPKDKAPSSGSDTNPKS